MSKVNDIDSTPHHPLVSVLMTAFNREQYIGVAIRSVLSSTYRNFELIVVDDSSSDNTVSIVKEFCKADTRVKLYVNEKNFGDYPNRNIAASYSNGEYIKFLDSDDYIYPHGLEVMVKQMQMFPMAAWGICCSALLPEPFPLLSQPKDSFHLNFLGPGLFRVGPSSTIISRETFTQLQGFPIGRMISDTDMWYKMALSHAVVLLPEGLIWKRSHPDQELIDKVNYLSQGEKLKWNYFRQADAFFNANEKGLIKKKWLRKYSLFALSAIKKLDIKQARKYSSLYWYVFRN